MLNPKEGAFPPGSKRRRVTFDLGVFQTSDITELISRLRPPTPSAAPRPRASSAGPRARSASSSEDDEAAAHTIAGVPCPF